LFYGVAGAVLVGVPWGTRSMADWMPGGDAGEPGDSGEARWRNCSPRERRVGWAVGELGGVRGFEGVEEAGLVALPAVEELG